MKKTINFYDFVEGFRNVGRENQFSYEGLEVLFEYLDECYEDLEFDPIGICCDFSEYKSIEEALKAYGVDFDNEATKKVLLC